MKRVLFFAFCVALAGMGGYIGTGLGSPPPCRGHRCPTTTSTTSTTSTTTVPAGEPAPIAGQGYHLAYDEQFASLAGWTDHIWYQSATAGTVYTSAGDLFVKSRRSDGWRQGNATTYGHRSFQHGYFEARLKWTGVVGAWPAFWLFSNAHPSGGTSASLLTSEIDVQEGDGRYPNGYNTALHKNSSGLFGVPDQQCPAGGGNWHTDLGHGDLTSSFHTYGLLWTSSGVSWFLDGVRVAGPCAPFANSTEQPMFVLLSMWPGGAVSGSFTPPSTGPAELVTVVDWVRVWQQ